MPSVTTKLHELSFIFLTPLWWWCMSTSSVYFLYKYASGVWLCVVSDVYLFFYKSWMLTLSFSCVLSDFSNNYQYKNATSWHFQLINAVVICRTTKCHTCCTEVHLKVWFFQCCVFHTLQSRPFFPVAAFGVPTPNPSFLWQHHSCTRWRGSSKSPMIQHKQ